MKAGCQVRTTQGHPAPAMVHPLLPLSSGERSSRGLSTRGRRPRPPSLFGFVAPIDPPRTKPAKSANRNTATAIRLHRRGFLFQMAGIPIRKLLALTINPPPPEDDETPEEGPTTSRHQCAPHRPTLLLLFTGSPPRAPARGFARRMP